MTKIAIFSGFLGAGKTTLIKKLINELYSEEKPVLIENDFSELDIDGGFMQDANITVTSINQGCICCSLSGDFVKALAKLMEDYPLSRILIEPSGVGKLSEIVNAIKTSGLDAEIDACVAVADVNKCKIYSRNFGEFYKDQIASASAIMLSRTQTSTFEQTQQAIGILREMNSDAPIITTPWNTLNIDELRHLMIGVRPELLELPDDDHDEHCSCGHHDHDGHHHHDDHDEHCSCGHHDHGDHDEHCTCGHHDHDEHCTCGHHDHDGHHHHDDHDEHCTCDHHDHDEHHADEVFSSWSKETPKSFTEQQLHNIMLSLDSGEYGDILRAKGIVASDGTDWIHFDYVPKEQNIRSGPSCYTGRLCVIGTGLENDKLSTLFDV